jgi:hypothetical protein
MPAVRTRHARTQARLLPTPAGSNHRIPARPPHELPGRRRSARKARKPVRGSRSACLAARGVVRQARRFAKVEGNEDQRRAAARQARREGEAPSAQKETTGASKQCSHRPRHESHEEKAAAIHQGKQGWQRTPKPGAAPGRDLRVSAFVWRHQPGGLMRDSGKSQVAEIGTLICSPRPARPLARYALVSTTPLFSANPGHNWDPAASQRLIRLRLL